MHAKVEVKITAEKIGYIEIINLVGKLINLTYCLTGVTTQPLFFICLLMLHRPKPFMPLVLVNKQLRLSQEQYSNFSITQLVD